MMDNLCPTWPNSESTENSELMNSERIKQGRKDLGYMSSLEVLKSNKSDRGYPTKC